MYPADASTDGRDDDGCGPSMDDLHYGSRGYDHAGWFGKQLLKANVLYYKDSMFGANRTFQSIPCDEFYKPSRDFNSTQAKNPPVIGQISRDFTWEFQTLLAENQINQWSYIMNQSVCNTSHPVPKPNIDNSTASPQLFYIDHKSWEANKWNSVIQMMEQALDDHPALKVWNEFMLNVSTGDSEADFDNRMVQAVFYIKENGVMMDEIAWRVPIREARRMNKLLLHVDLNDHLDSSNQDLFHCESMGDPKHFRASGRSEAKFLRAPK
jgi:hypothetical protein